MSVKTEAAEGEPVSLEIAEQHPKNMSSQLPASLTLCLCLAEEIAHGCVEMGLVG